MTNLLVRTTCKDCGKDGDHELPDELKEALKKPKATLVESPTDKKLDAVLDALKTKTPEPVKETKEKIIVPSYLPRFTCKGKDCVGDDNDGYITRVKKKCNNCDQFAPENAKKCSWCGEEDFDDIDDEELDGLKIPKPAGGHQHE